MQLIFSSKLKRKNESFREKKRMIGPKNEGYLVIFYGIGRLFLFKKKKGIGRLFVHKEAIT